MLSTITECFILTLLARSARALPYDVVDSVLQICSDDQMPGSKSDFKPDPPVIRSNLHGWYALGPTDSAGILQQTKTYAKNYSKQNIQVATSTDLINWDLLPPDDASLMPDPGAWAPTGASPFPEGLPPAPDAKAWASDLWQQTSGSTDLLIYYSAVDKASPPQHCIGIVSAPSSSSPTGPFKPTSSAPLICPTEYGGAIDGSIFAEPRPPPQSSKRDGSGSVDPSSQDLDKSTGVYIVYNIDGNSKGSGGECGNSEPGPKQASTPILLQALDSSGLPISGGTKQILDRTSDDGPLVQSTRPCGIR
ncbi:MAG: hypothetical protein M1820_008672 [Bogoriella megaspora]|nr:MAG: hypothetical protein M1820_008672 [Bogoriella megaspora]